MNFLYMFSPYHLVVCLQKADIVALRDEMASVKSQLTEAEHKLSSFSLHHEAELTAVRDQLSKVRHLKATIAQFRNKN